MLVCSFSGGKQVLESCSRAPASKIFPTQVIPAAPWLNYCHLHPTFWVGDNTEDSLWAFFFFLPL